MPSSSDSDSDPAVLPALRKLIRPRLEDQPGTRRSARNKPAHPAPVGNTYQGNHAEIFYFQKQMQTQTALVFVLEDGEKIEGVIEWYDARSIKVRNHTRMLIYKSSIKYMYKAGDFS